MDGKVERSLYLEQTLCAFDDRVLKELSLIILHEESDIALSIADSLASLFLEGTSGDTMTVSIYIPTIADPTTWAPTSSGPSSDDVAKLSFCEEFGGANCQHLRSSLRLSLILQLLD